MSSESEEVNSQGHVKELRLYSFGNRHHEGILNKKVTWPDTYF